jgi:hypothetical protein
MQITKSKFALAARGVQLDNGVTSPWFWASFLGSDRCTKFCIWCRVVLYVIVVTFLVKLVMNKFTSIPWPLWRLLLFLYPWTLGSGCAQFKPPSLLSHFPPIYHGFWHWNNPPKTSNHALTRIHCHYCNVDFVLFRNVTCYTDSLLSCIHVDTTDLLNITCTLFATCVILGRLECIVMGDGNLDAIHVGYWNKVWYILHPKISMMTYCHEWLKFGRKNT